MRRFIEEIKVEDPELANAIVAALETKVSARGNMREVDMVIGSVYDSKNPCVFLRIYERETVE